MARIGMSDFMQQLPEGLATTVNSDNVSVGQQQLLTVARAMYHDSPVIIFDEATSSLDSASEQMVRSRGKGTVLRAHRHNNRAPLLQHRTGRSRRSNEQGQSAGPRQAQGTATAMRTVPQAVAGAEAGALTNKRYQKHPTAERVTSQSSFGMAHPAPPKANPTEPGVAIQDSCVLGSWMPPTRMPVEGTHI